MPWSPPQFNQVQVDYDHTVAGNATFTVNNITYNETSTIPCTDLLFDVSAVDGDGDWPQLAFRSIFRAARPWRPPSH